MGAMKPMKNTAMLTTVFYLFVPLFNSAKLLLSWIQYNLDFLILDTMLQSAFSPFRVLWLADSNLS